MAIINSTIFGSGGQPATPNYMWVDLGEATFTSSTPTTSTGVYNYANNDVSISLSEGEVVVRCYVNNTSNWYDSGAYDNACFMQALLGDGRMLYGAVTDVNRSSGAWCLIYVIYNTNSDTFRRVVLKFKKQPLHSSETRRYVDVEIPAYDPMIPRYNLLNFSGIDRAVGFWKGQTRTSSKFVDKWTIYQGQGFTGVIPLRAFVLCRSIPSNIPTEIINRT